ncbi:ABC transporter ATP-binding protein [Solirubrobacter deserti]|uniref:ABC transporter ATP-binding protein n=1 Tax=Solirubrobacter deserti TaxID=2282478 RepID=A0ABT4RDH0_9ACTN|nr:ABC transporter ATP-binding protein [Solirubrobacter deserti]MDA0136576.1 ABC transporter ATP-binding protein [Solirubrobacter deserti]
MSLALAGVVKRYGERTALDGVDFEVGAGEVVALLGPNGAGKSTLVSIAAGLLKADAGSVSVRGRPGLAPQDIGIYPSLTVRENLWAFAELHGVSRRRAERLLAPFVLTELADRAAGTLSGGEQRRLHTALAVVHRPRLVLLDEPTAGADTQTRSAILRAVLELASDGAAVVYTTHYLPEVEELDAGVALLEAGRIIATGSVSELVAAHAESVVEITYTDGRTVRRAGTSLHGLGDDVVRAEVIRPSLEAAYLALTGRRSAE